MKSVRVRFAPSPTGRLHIGNARTAILNWLFARHSKGQFVLRIEDTDAERSSRESEESILNDLKWLGLDWDEGPDVSGPVGPYRQSERLEIYRQYLEQLKSSRKAYPCFCSEEELQQHREAALARGENPHYDRRCLQLSETERTRRLQAGDQAVWRFHVRDGEVSWEDLVKGRLEFQSEQFGDFVLVRADGVPTYNFAVTVDDGLMQITHVVRGDDHVSNTPRQLLIYEALGWTPPHFAHIPMILGPDRARLSKRHGATSVAEFRERGYLPEALVNFLSLLSWSSESGDEILPVERLIAEFSFERVNKSPAIFDITKFNWMNGHYIRNLELADLLQLAEPYLREAGIDVGDRARLTEILRLVRDAVDSLAELPEQVRPFYRDEVVLTDGEAIAVASRDASQKIYWAFLRYLQNYDTLEADTFRTIMKQVQKETGIMGKELWVPIRVALTGKLHGPDLPAVAAILGRERCEQFVKNLTD